jgi:hypothetical protein
MDLHAYIDAELDGKDATARFPAVRAHLNTCTECRDAYDEVKSLLLKERQGMLAQPPMEPALDFSYLEDAGTQAGIWEQVERLGVEANRLVVQLRVLISQQAASLHSLPAPLAPSWVAVPALRDESADVDRDLQVLTLPSPDQDVVLRLVVGPVTGGVITLGLQATQGSSGQPLARARVNLRDEKHRVLVGDLTDADGRVSFTRISAGSYLLEARHGDALWELPISIVPERERE